MEYDDLENQMLPGPSIASMFIIPLSYHRFSDADSLRLQPKAMLPCSHGLNTQDLERRRSERLHALVRVMGVTGEQIEMDVYGIDPAQIRKDEKAVIQAISLVEGISAEDLCQISVSEKIIDVNIDDVPDKPYHGCARERWIRA